MAKEKSEKLNIGEEVYVDSIKKAGVVVKFVEPTEAVPTGYYEVKLAENDTKHFTPDQLERVK